MNQVVLMGNVGRDAELRYTKSGTPVVNLNLATHNRPKGSDETKTEWHRVVVWGDTALRVADRLQKGAQVWLQGSLRYKTYQPTEGEARTVAEVHTTFVRVFSKTNQESETIPVASAEEPAF